MIPYFITALAAFLIGNTMGKSQTEQKLLAIKHLPQPAKGVSFIITKDGLFPHADVKSYDGEIMMMSYNPMKRAALVSLDIYRLMHLHPLVKHIKNTTQLRGEIVIDEQIGMFEIKAVDGPIFEKIIKAAMQYKPLIIDA